MVQMLFKLLLVAVVSTRAFHHPARVSSAFSNFQKGFRHASVMSDVSRAASFTPLSRRQLLVGATAGLAYTQTHPVQAAAPAASTAPMNGKTVVITGANSGLGLATATELAKAGGTVVLAVRDAARGEEAAESIRRQTSSGTVEVSQLDLADLSSVAAFARRWGDRTCDVLMLNAGVMAIPERSFTADGFERHLGVNHLGHFALTALLWPRLLQAATRNSDGARVVVVSSDAHKQGEISFDDLNLDKPGAYKSCNTPACSAYTQSKLANVLFAKELERRIPEDLNVAVSSLSPGLVNTALFRYSLPDLKADTGTGAVEDPSKLDTLYKVQGFFMTAPIKAAQTQLALASQPTLNRAAVGGRYYVDGKPVVVSKTADDPEVAAKLWEVSEEMTGIKFNPTAAP